MRVHLAAVLAAASSVSAVTTNFYWYVPDMDAPNQDVTHDGGDVETLARLCDANKDCQGFNTDGYLKSCVTASCQQATTATSLYLKKSTPMPPGLWPKPTTVTGLDGTTLSADSTSFAFKAASGSSPLLERAFTRYMGVAFNQRLPTPPVPPGLGPQPSKAGLSAAQAALRVAAGALTGLSVSVKTVEPPLAMGMDESYTLDIPATGGAATLTANTTWGALRGLERFSQLVWWSGTGSTFVVHTCSIVDAPRFSHRGMLVDTSRHFLKMDAIKMTLDALAYNFATVFHWHIVDDQSFPYESVAFPEMSKAAAFSPTHVYSQADVAEVISYARDRGIRVVIEFDTPGHTRSWGVSHPELLVPCYSDGQPNGDRYGMNPLLNSTFDFVNTLYKEIATVFPDTYVHVGGDELSFGPGSCWQSNPDLQKWIASHGNGSYAALENLYEQSLVKIVSGTGKSLIGWQELFDNGIDLPDDFVVNVWKGGWEDEMANVTKTFRTVLSSPYYENYINNPYSTGGDWKSYYTVDPLGWTGTAAQKANLMGCEVSFWAEYIDATNLFGRAFPRASAAFERFWSPTDVNDPTEALGRLRAHRCRMVARGIPAEPVEGPSFCADEYNVVYQPPFSA